MGEARMDVLRVDFDRSVSSDTTNRSDLTDASTDMTVSQPFVKPTNHGSLRWTGGRDFDAIVLVPDGCRNPLTFHPVGRRHRHTDRVQSRSQCPRAK